MDISLLFPLIILLLFIPIFLSSRKQKRAQQQMQSLQQALQPGDVVTTTSGLRGTVVDASYEDTIDLEIADGIVTTWLRAAIRERISQDGQADQPAADDTAAPAVEDAPSSGPSLEKAPSVDGAEAPEREKDDSTNGSPRS